jgi:hypothetical protein
MTKTQQCFRDGKWQVDELANLSENLERELNQLIKLTSRCCICGETAYRIYPVCKNHKTETVAAMPNDPDQRRQ